MVQRLTVDRNGVERLVYINPDKMDGEGGGFNIVDYINVKNKSMFRAIPAKLTKTISYQYNDDGIGLFLLDGEDGGEIAFTSDELDGLSEAVENKIDRDIRDGEIFNRGRISIILKDGWDYTPEDDKVIIKDNVTGKRIKVEWKDIRELARKNDLLRKSLGRSRKKISASRLQGGDIVDISPLLQEAYNNLDPSQLDSEQAEMLEVLIAECEDNYFLIQEVEYFNDNVAVYNETGDRFEIGNEEEVYVDSNDVSANPLWGAVS